MASARQSRPTTAPRPASTTDKTDLPHSAPASRRSGVFVSGQTAAHSFLRQYDRTRQRQRACKRSTSRNYSAEDNASRYMNRPRPARIGRRGLKEPVSILRQPTRRQSDNELHPDTRTSRRAATSRSDDCGNNIPAPKTPRPTHCDSLSTPANTSSDIQHRIPHAPQHAILRLNYDYWSKKATFARYMPASFGAYDLRCLKS